jgi:hypothetical protein
MWRNSQRLNPAPLALLFGTPLLTIAIGLSANPAQAITYQLFKQSANQLPAQQRWLAQVAGASQTLQSGAVVLNTSGSSSLQSGYARLAPLGNLPMSLDRTRGYTFSIDLKLLAESHQSTHRAGFSTIVVGSDLQGIELGFWLDRVWAQNYANNLFTQAEGSSINTKNSVHYDVVVQANRYCVFANRNYTKPLLKGPLRNYSGFGSPYNIRNFAFIGDNTKSASATVAIGNIDLQDSPIATCPSL